jgi:hypothetical protein
MKIWLGRSAKEAPVTIARRQPEAEPRSWLSPIARRRLSRGSDDPVRAGGVGGRPALVRRVPAREAGLPGSSSARQFRVLAASVGPNAARSSTCGSPPSGRSSRTPRARSASIHCAACRGPGLARPEHRRHRFRPPAVGRLRDRARERAAAKFASTQPQPRRIKGGSRRPGRSGRMPQPGDGVGSAIQRTSLQTRSDRRPAAHPSGARPMATGQESAIPGTGARADGNEGAAGAADLERGAR